MCVSVTLAYESVERGDPTDDGRIFHLSLLLRAVASLTNARWQALHYHYWMDILHCEPFSLALFFPVFLSSSIRNCDDCDEYETISLVFFFFRHKWTTKALKIKGMEIEMKLYILYMFFFSFISMEECCKSLMQSQELWLICLVYLNIYYVFLMPMHIWIIWIFRIYRPEIYHWKRSKIVDIFEWSHRSRVENA